MELSNFFSAAEGRLDRWRTLHRIAKALAGAGGRDTEALRQEAQKLLADMAPIEDFCGCYELAYSRNMKRPGYYLRNQPPISPELSAIVDNSIAEVDPEQIAIFKQLSFGQRFRPGCSISNLARQIVANRIQQRNPHLTLTEANRLAIQKSA